MPEGGGDDETGCEADGRDGECEPDHGSNL
jgi:hypothetical protein